MSITGASGHLGANLVRRLLSQGRTVRVLVHRDKRALEGLQVEIVQGSLHNKSDLDRLIAGANSVYHLAAQISVDGAMGGLVSQTNTQGTQNVVNACIEHEVEKLVHFSSIHALADAPHRKEETIDEERDLALGPDQMEYGRSKAQAEQIVLDAVKAGLNASIVNPGGVLGPHDYKPSRMGQVLMQLHDGKMPALVEGGFAWVDVRDVVEAAIQAETRGGIGQRYLLAGPWASFRQLADTISSVTGKPAPKFVSPMWLAKWGVPFVGLLAKLTGQEPNYTMESLCAIQCHRNISCEKAKRELGFKPRPLTETIEDTFAWFKARGDMS
ncbi:MAG: NAD-dependent epimerase/dehydratase family protein [Myxococcota bacterium]|nr:NAD-dependent epimerase/dehydratase family protein [Myxococcota bacterium]